MQLPKWLGTTLFFVTLPGLYFYLKKDERTRVIVKVGDEILLLKGWYGSNKWMLPGGGMYHGEQPAAAAVRELYEETGITALVEQLDFIACGTVRDDYGLRYTYRLFVLELSSRPIVTDNTIEIYAARWQSAQTAAQDVKGVLRATRTTLGVWMKRQNLI